MSKRMKVGIDFGTSTSEIAYVNSSGIHVLPNHVGELITPSVVYLPLSGEPLVGQEAKEKAFVEPENTFIEVKRLFGQNAVLEARGKTYTPVDIAAMIIKYLVDCAQTHTKEQIDSAVITVPAYFTDSQRTDVMAAGKAAGLSVERIINEPTAASLDYGIEHMRDCKHILVYDLGGGTLDVTVLELFEGVVDVKSSCGNNALGGKDFDETLISHITDKIKRVENVDVTKDARAMMRIKMETERCKIALSDKDEYLFELPFLYTKGKDNEPSGYTEKISRELFETLVKPLIYSTDKQIKTALSDANLQPEDIDLCLLIGGSTRIPLVHMFLNQTFGFEPKVFVDPDLAVVRGATIQAGVLS
ncbi:MAG: Hsp70 family protein, partial [Oscillospiraceae bacterium]|nr:Hsp70 family protein [Oscillospiraceae bacterium]